MLKRGQVTIFIIIAILIVAVVVSYFVIFEGNIQANKIPKNLEPIYQRVEECLELTSEEALIYIGQYGGYYNVPESIALDYFGEKIPYYYLDNQENIPEKERIELELNNYTNDKIENCLNFEDFISQGLNISSGKPEILTLIKENSVKFSMNYLLAVSMEDETQVLKEFNVVAPFNINELLDSSKEIVDDYSKEPGVLCISCLNEISIKNEINISSIFFENNTIITISSEGLEGNNKNKLNWVFAMGK